MIPTNLFHAAVTVFAFTLWVLSIFSYKKSRNTKLLIVSFAFLLFFIKGIVVSLYGLTGWVIWISPSYLAVFDFVILVLLFAAVLR